MTNVDKRLFFKSFSVKGRPSKESYITSCLLVNLAKIDKVIDDAPLKQPHSTIQPSVLGSKLVNPYFNKIILASKLVAD